MLDYVVFDFETASVCNLKASGAARYAADPSTSILCAAYLPVIRGVERELRVCSERDLFDRDSDLMRYVLDPSVTFVAHNVAFEYSIWRHVMVGLYGWPEMPIERWHDTIAVCARKGIPLSLDRATRHLGLSSKKDMEGRALMLQLCKPNRLGEFDRTPQKLERLYRYCVSDIRAQHDLHKALGGLGDERKVWLLNEKINHRGIGVDTGYVTACMSLLEKAKKPMLEEFSALTGGLRPTQRAKILSWVQERVDGVYDMQKETLDALLAPDTDTDGVERLAPYVRRVIELRRIMASTAVAKLRRMLETQGFDGRIRGTMQYHGAHTGRVAGRLVQPQNMPRPTIDLDGGTNIKDLMRLVRAGDLGGLTAKGINAYDAVVSSLRACFRPEKGKIFCAGDFNAIEARIVLTLAGEHDRASSFDIGDPYCDMASQIYECEVTGKGPKRQMGKMTVLGAGFGMGALRFQAQAAPDQSLEFAETCIATYRKEFAPLVPKLWYGLHDASTKAVWCKSQRAYSYRDITYQVRGAFLECRLPSGRALQYYSPRPTREPVPWDDEDLRPSWTFYSSQSGGVRKGVFGGFLAENVSQAIGRDLMVHAMFNCETGGMPVVFTVHDELVCEVDEGRPDAAQELKSYMEDTPQWCRDMQLPIKAECEIQTEYGK